MVSAVPGTYETEPGPESFFHLVAFEVKGAISDSPSGDRPAITEMTEVRRLLPNSRCTILSAPPPITVTQAALEPLSSCPKGATKRH